MRCKAMVDGRKCGSMKEFNIIVLCVSCIDKFYDMYPLGWRDTPGDSCKHGVYTGRGGNRAAVCDDCLVEGLV